MINLVRSGFFVLLLLAGCGWDGTPTRSNDFTPLTSIVIVATPPTIAAHTSTRLAVIGNFSGQFTRDVTDQATWSSDAPTVAEFATAAEPNRVTGRAPGSAILTATVGSVSSTFALTVSSATVTALAITPADPSIAKGLNTQFDVSGTFSDATTQDLTFDANWVSSDPGVATVSDAVGSKGLVQTLAAGTSTITATFDGISGTTLLTVTQPVLQSITVTPANPSILAISSVNFRAVGNFSDGSVADITSLASWSSTSSGVATISAGGAAKTLAQGTATINATLDGVTGASNIKVTGGTLTGIAISPTSLTLIKDTTGLMTATGSFNNGSSRDITGAVEWSVANSAVATVATPGGNQALITPVEVTAATRITAKSGLVSADTNLTVIAPLLQTIAISPTTLELSAGASSRLVVTATFRDGATQDVTTNSDWTTNDATTASVGNSGLDKGRVRGIATGTATISAVYGGLTVRTIVTVRTRTVQVLTISGPVITTIGNQVKFTATASYADGTSADVTEDTTWTIDNPNVAILADSQNQPGQVVMVDSGTATLTASFGGRTRTANLTVP